MRKTYGTSITSQFQFANPIDWKKMTSEFTKVNKFLGSTQNTVQTLNQMGISTLLVQHTGCGTGIFSTFDNTTEMYWGERWELYKYSYVIAVWARSNLVSEIEFYNEPDLDLFKGLCSSASEYRDIYLIRSMSIQNAYQDVNGQVNQTFIEASVIASAFAFVQYNGNASRYLGELSVQNKNVSIV
jgi:hypothetical protein